MTILISYRGIFEGKDYENANTPEQLGKAFNHGYSVLVDAWKVDGIFYLGNDQPVTEVQPEYLRGNRFWINARNAEMQQYVLDNYKLYPHYFWFPDDTESTPVIISSGQYLVPGTVQLSLDTIVFLPEITDRGLLSTVKLSCYGICSTYLTFIKRMRTEGLWY